MREIVIRWVSCSRGTRGRTWVLHLLARVDEQRAGGNDGRVEHSHEQQAEPREAVLKPEEATHAGWHTQARREGAPA